MRLKINTQDPGPVCSGDMSMQDLTPIPNSPKLGEQGVLEFPEESEN